MTVAIWLNYARVESRSMSVQDDGAIWLNYARVESRSMSVQDDGRYLVELCTGRIKVHVSAG